MKTSAALDVVKQAYEAYGRRDLPAILDLVAEKTTAARYGY
jgi:ketosteroid isomerase-like protein